MWQIDVPRGAFPIGYRHLIEQHRIEILTHYRWSYVGPGWEAKEFRYDDLNLELHLYPKSYAVGDDSLKNLEFALKHEGLNLGIIKRVLSSLGPKRVAKHILASPTGKYARKIWFLYEFLLDERLSIDDIGRGSYVPLVNPKDYYSGKEIRSPRHRILNNLLGVSGFFPLVRRSSRLEKFERQDLANVAATLVSRYDSNILARAIRYLYTKETMASWEIEREKPDKSKIARFVSLLQRDYSRDEITKEMLVKVQKEIVDPRFALEDYRDFQNYVGEEPLPGDVILHYICPKPQDLVLLMEGLIACAERMFSSKIDPVVAATILSFGFVYMHPFEDGNGRLHRFLIHYVLSKLAFTPSGIVFPISAVILRESREYDRALESFSKPLCKLIDDYEISDRGEMTVNSDTVEFYKYIDFTPIVEFLYRCVEQTIYIDLEDELNFLSRYNEIKKEIKNIVDMPDRQIDLFIKCVRQNNDTLSTRKRTSLFSKLTDSEILQMEEVVRRSTAL